MKELPTKEQILEKHYFNYYRKSFPSDERANEVVGVALSIKEETGAIIAAMEEYAALRAMPLVEALEKINNFFIPALIKLYGDGPMNPATGIRDLIDNQLAKYKAGGADKKEEANESK